MSSISFAAPWRGTLPRLAAALIALFFCAGGLANLFPTDAVAADYERWGYPPTFSRVTGLLELTVALLVVFERSRWLGIALGGAVMLAAFTTLIVNGEFVHALMPFAVLIALWGLHLLTRRAIAARFREYRA